MKIRTIIATSALVLGLGVAPAFAQTAEQDMQQYISSHPALQQNPSLMNNPSYLASHPDLSHFLQAHPQVDPHRIGGSAYNQRNGTNGLNGRYGTYGQYNRRHQWSHRRYHGVLER
jgi:hypothetical protein